MKKTLITDFNRIVTVEAEVGAVYLTVEDTGTGETTHARLDLTETAVLQEFLSEALEPQKFYLKLLNNKAGYMNRSRIGTVGYLYMVDSKGNGGTWQTQFTQAEIDSDPELKKFEAFKVPVEDVA